MVVDAGGNITLPLAGTIHVAGMTASELSQEISRRLEAYLVTPRVTAALTQPATQRVTVDGSVEQPGVYVLQGKTTLIDAVAMARGTNRTAALDQVIVFREINGRMAAARFNIKDIRMGSQPNPEILPNDTIVIGFNNLKGLYRDLVLSSPLISSFSYIITR